MRKSIANTLDLMVSRNIVETTTIYDFITDDYFLSLYTLTHIKLYILPRVI
jgi:hypothetical protein